MTRRGLLGLIGAALSESKVAPAPTAEFLTSDVPRAAAASPDPKLVAAQTAFYKKRSLEALMGKFQLHEQVKGLPKSCGKEIIFECRAQIDPGPRIADGTI